MRKLILIAIIGFGILFPSSVKAQFSGCPQTCTEGQKLWISTSCQQRRLRLSPEAAGCCLYYCSEQPDESRSLGNSDPSATDFGLDPFSSSLKLDTPQGIATLIATAFQMFLGAVAIYAVVTAIRSAMLLANASNPEAIGQARKNITSAVIGIVICATALGVLQLLINLLGLGSIGQVFDALNPVLNSGSR